MLRYDIRTGARKIKTKTFMAISGITLGTAGLAMAVAMPLATKAASPTLWQAQAPTSVNFVCGGGNYPHTLQTVSEDNTGNLSGTGNYNVDTSYTWNMTGSVSGDSLTMLIHYTGTAAGTEYNLTGTIASNGSVSGTVDNNCQSFTMPAGSFLHYTDVVVTPSNTHGWSKADTRPGGAVNYVSDSSAPGNPHEGALQLTTDGTNAAKAQYMHSASIALNEIKSLSYSTKQNTGPSVAAASYQLPANLNGTSGFTTLVYEPYWNGTVDTSGNWQSWDVDSGQFWSSNTIVCSNGTVNGAAGGPATYTLTQIESICPNAQVIGFGVNIGSYNPNYDVETDLVNFNGTTYNFEPYVVATDKESCKNGGWQNVTDNNGSAFKNQGQCVSWTEHYVNGNGSPALSKPSH